MTNKIYLKVMCVTKEDGLMLPRAFEWVDGLRFKIDRVSDIKPGYTMKNGRLEDRYTIWVNGLQSYMYFERSNAITGNNIGRWFVERSQ